MRISKAIDPKRARGISFLMVALSTFKGKIQAVIPIIKEILIKFEPTIFPTEILSLPLIAAEILTAASGALVPKATIVKPMIIGGILKNLARPDEPETNKSARFTGFIEKKYLLPGRKIATSQARKLYQQHSAEKNSRYLGYYEQQTSPCTLKSYLITLD